PRHVGGGVEAAVPVAADGLHVVGCFHVGVEGVGGRHVGEVGAARGVYVPLHGQHGYLGKLGAGGEVVGAEGVVGVAGDRAHRVEVAHRLVEVVGRLHVREIHSGGGGSIGGSGGHAGSRGRGVTGFERPLYLEARGEAAGVARVLSVVVLVLQHADGGAGAVLADLAVDEVEAAGLALVEAHLEVGGAAAVGIVGGPPLDVEDAV